MKKKSPGQGKVREFQFHSFRPRPSGLGEIDGLHGTSTQSCILTYDLCTGEPLRRPKPAQDEWYMIMSGHPFIKALAAYCSGAFVQGLRCHFISMPGKSPMKLEVTSRHDHSCLLGRKASKQASKFHSLKYRKNDKGQGKVREFKNFQKTVVKRLLKIISINCKHLIMVKHIAFL